ncbi:MAG TPA: hypothetical protein VGB45_08720 [Abditibacterium sp.]|jgi:hypothetical protein
MNENQIAFIFHEVETRLGVLWVAEAQVAREGDLNPANNQPFSLNDLSALADRINNKVEEMVDEAIGEHLDDSEV